MAKQIKKKPHAQGVGAELVENPSELLDLLITNNDEKEWAVNELTNEGPEHKQVYSALLMSRMYQLVKAVELNTGAVFSIQKGAEIISAKDGTILPIPLPATVAKKNKMEAVAENISHSPAHELVMFTSLLQAIEWSIKSLNKKQSWMRKY